MVEAGLPAILGKFKNIIGAEANTVSNGACTRTYLGGAGVGNGGYFSRYDLDFNTDDSDSVYGNSDTVQPPALQLIPQIKY